MDAQTAVLVAIVIIVLALAFWHWVFNPKTPGYVD